MLRARPLCLGPFSPLKPRRMASLLAILALSLSARAASDGAEEATPRLDAKQPRHVRALYLDTLGRTPDADELDLASMGRPNLLLRSLCNSREFWMQWYEEELYYFLLVDNFRPEDVGDGMGDMSSAKSGMDGSMQAVSAAGSTSLPSRLNAGDLHILDAVRTLASSAAFNRANPGNDTFVSVVFEQLLGLTVQSQPALLEAGKRMYDGQRASLWGMEGRSQADVVRIACAQPAFAEVIIRRQYQRFLGHEPSRKQVRAWAAELVSDPHAFPDMVRGWLESEPYARRLESLRLKSDRQFIRGLYVDLTGAPPSLESMQRHRTALAAVADSGPLRSVIARVLLSTSGSGYRERQDPVDAPPLVRDVFLRFLGREPGPEELEAFALTYEQCDCEPELLVRAVTTHQEYQYY